LQSDEPVAGASRARAAQHLAVNRSRELNARGLERRREREQHGRSQRGAHEKQRHAPIPRRDRDTQVADVGREAGGDDVHGAVQHEARDAVGERRGNQREQQALDEQLPHDAPPRCADREPDTDLALPRQQARQQ
jgi:hypothetical protein